MTRIWIKSKSDTSNWPGVNAPVVLVDGSDATAVDDALRHNLSPGASVYLGPGVFMTMGACGNSFAQLDAPGWRMQSGARLIGSGATTLKLAAANSSYGGVVVASSATIGGQPTTARDMVVSDLEVDCNAPELVKPAADKPLYLQGIQLTSAGGCRIERVTVRNACALGEAGAPAKTECFVLAINAADAASDNNLISNCVVRDYFSTPGKGGWCSAIGMYNQRAGGRINGVIEDCDVTLNGNGGEFACNGSNMSEVIIRRCKSRGAARGFCNDTWPNYAITIEDCTFDLPGRDCIGVLLLKPNVGSTFARNTILLRGANACGFLVEKSSASEDIVIRENTIAGLGAWSGPAYALNLNSNLDPAKIPAGVSLLYNAVTDDAGRVEVLAPSSIGKQAGNTFNGAEWLWPAVQPEA